MRRLKKIILAAFCWYKVIRAWLHRLFFVMRGRRPWSLGYFEYKWHEIEKALKNKEVGGILSDQQGDLPPGYGLRLDERIVELPWALANVPLKSVRVLDLGSALNFYNIVGDSRMKRKKLTIMTLAPESNCFWRNGISYLFGDARDVPFKDGLFDLVVCLSTLEHVGMNNMLYTGDKNMQGGGKMDYRIALKEIRRVLVPGGTALLSVPFGRYRDIGFMQQFDSSMIDDVVATFEPSQHAVEFFCYTREGWRRSTEEECRDLGYYYVRKDPRPADGVAAARSVACLTLVR